VRVLYSQRLDWIGGGGHLLRTADVTIYRSRPAAGYQAFEHIVVYVVAVAGRFLRRRNGAGLREGRDRGRMQGVPFLSRQNYRGVERRRRRSEHGRAGIGSAPSQRRG
jgi:hypothetical protein